MTIRGRAVRKCHAVCVTYRRPEALASTLMSLSLQKQAIASMTIVDNDPNFSAAMVRFPSDSTATLVIPAGRNLGPAGGFHVGIESVLQRADDGDWLFFVDDDDPPVDEDVLTDALSAAEAAEEMGWRVGAAGCAGARLGSNGRLQRISDAEHGLVQVDYIGSGNYPLYSVKALRSLKTDFTPLFFGFEDLAIGLELEAAGFVLVVDADKLYRRRTRRGVAGATPRQARLGHEPPAWRRYYSARNLTTLVALHRGAVRGAVCAIMEIGAGVRAGVVTRDPDRLSASVAGVIDALRGRSGVRYLPEVPLRKGKF